MLNLPDTLGTLAQKWDAVLQRPGRWSWPAVATALGVGLLAGFVLWLPDNRITIFQSALVVLALAVPQLFFRVSGAAVVTGAGMVVALVIRNALFGGVPDTLVTFVVILGAAVLAELVNLWGKSPRWTLRRGTLGAVLGGMAIAAMPLFAMDFDALFGGEDPALIGAFLAYVVLAVVIVVLSGAIYGVVRVVLGVVLTAMVNSPGGSVGPTPE